MPPASSLTAPTPFLSFWVLTGEVGLFEMRGAGLSAVKDAAALFAPATAAAAAAAADEAAAGGSSKGQLVGTAVGVVQEGIRPLPLEIQALATARLQETVSAATADAYDEDDSYNDSATDDASETELSEAADEAEPDGPDDMDYAGAAADGDEEDDLGGIGFGSSLVQSSRKERVELAGTAHELAPLYRHYVGVADRNRMAMLLELLTKHTPIKVRGPALEAAAGCVVHTLPCSSAAAWLTSEEGHGWGPMQWAVWKTGRTQRAVVHWTAWDRVYGSLMHS